MGCIHGSLGCRCIEADTLRRDVERLRRERDEATLTRIERETELRAKVSSLRKMIDDMIADNDEQQKRIDRLTSERDAAYAASLRSDEVHAEAMRAVRARAEKAEAERDEARGQHAELLDALRSQERPDPSASDKDEILRLSSVVVIRNCEIAGLQLDLTAARAQVERLRNVLGRCVPDARETTLLEERRLALADDEDDEDAGLRYVLEAKARLIQMDPALAALAEKVVQAFGDVAVAAAEDGVDLAKDDAALADAAGEEKSRG